MLVGEQGLKTGLSGMVTSRDDFVHARRMAKDGNGVERISSENSTLDTMNHSTDNGGRVSVKTVNSSTQTISIVAVSTLQWPTAW